MQHRLRTPLLMGSGSARVSWPGMGTGFDVAGLDGIGPRFVCACKMGTRACMVVEAWSVRGCCLLSQFWAYVPPSPELLTVVASIWLPLGLATINLGGPGLLIVTATFLSWPFYVVLYHIAVSTVKRFRSPITSCMR